VPGAATKAALGTVALVAAPRKAVRAGKFEGNHDLKFTLVNGGMSVRKINPAVPKCSSTR
jgi:hypothetical protein